MEYFNLMEIIVADVVDEVLGRDDTLKSVKFHRNDIIAYALNRIPARYVTSERGVIHGRIDTRLRFQQHTDILFLIYEAIELFSGRRNSEVGDEAPRQEWRMGLVPHIIGEVLEESTLCIIPDVKVTLKYNNSAAGMMDENWNNPYYTSGATRGYYHFWPCLDQEIKEGQQDMEFTVVFEHEKFQPAQIKVLVGLNEKKEIGKTFSIPLVLMKLRDGVDASFLTD